MNKLVRGTIIGLAACTIGLTGMAQAAQQTEKEFQKLMPITGTVETFFGDFKTDHSLCDTCDIARDT